MSTDVCCVKKQNTVETGVDVAMHEPIANAVDSLPCFEGIHVFVGEMKRLRPILRDVDCV